MIARVLILLPFDLFIREGDELPSLEITRPDYHIKLFPPSHFVDRTKTAGGLMDPAISLRTAIVAPFTDNLLADGRRVAQVNVLILDFSKPEFDRSISAGKMPAIDPPMDLVFGVANLILAKLRVYTRAFQIKELVSERDSCHIHYLTDEGKQLEKEEGKIRACTHGVGTIGFATVTPDAISMIAREGSAEPYVWDQLLLDAHELLPDVGGSIAMAAAALETFIGWALDILHQQQRLPTGLWEWITTRNNDHTKEPSVSEKFDVLLRAFTGQSLKDQPELWKHHRELRDARNSLVHRGIAMVGKSPVDARKAKELVTGADKIMKWVELQLPLAWRRARTEATGPFRRRLASQPTLVQTLRITADDQNQRPIRVTGGDKPARSRKATVTRKKKRGSQKKQRKM